MSPMTQVREDERATEENTVTRARSRGAKVVSALWFILWTVIAVALVKFAFFPQVAADDANDVLDPGSAYGDLTVTPTTQTITNSLSLQGTVKRAAAVAVKSPLDGEVIAFFYNSGDWVQQGEAILQVRKEIQNDDVVTKDAEGNEVVTPGEKWWYYEDVLASATGTVTFDVLMDQPVTIGGGVASIQPSTFYAVAPLTPEQMYRLQKVPTDAQVTIKDGPAPFGCMDPTVLTPEPTGEGEEKSASIEMRCVIPEEVTVFPGLQVQLDLTAGKVEDALTLPLSAVEGRFATGFVYLPNAEGEPTKTAVTLGLSNDRVVQIESGIDAETEVLEFVPGTDAEQCIPDPENGVVCEDG